MEEIVRSADGAYTARKFRDNVWVIQDQSGPKSYAYLLLGSGKTILIDSGMNKEADLPAFIRTLSGKEVDVLLLTHGDADHIGAAGKFPCICAFAGELDHCGNKGLKAPVQPLWEHEIIDGGDIRLEVIFLPGHTPGGAGYLDRQNGLLFVGDALMAEPLIAAGMGRNLRAWGASFRKLEKMAAEGEFKMAMPGHAACPFVPDSISDFAQLAEEIMAGTAQPVPDVAPKLRSVDRPVRLYRKGGAEIIC